MSLTRRVFPFLRWFDHYSRATLRADFISGVTVALVLVPQSMAYAQLAGLPTYYGLYAAFLPPIVASLFGSSHQLATGPVAVVSLITSAALEPLATAGSEQYVAYALLLALMVGLFQFALGVLKLGLVVNFLSHPVVNGFTSAAALIIATSQLSKIFGVYVDKAPHHYETIYRVVAAALHHTHWPTVGVAALSFATMIILRKVNPRIPNVLVAVVVTTLLSTAVGFENNATIDCRQIRSEQAVNLIRAFNQTIKTREEFEVYRLDSQGHVVLAESGPQGLCLQCHELRKADRFKGDVQVTRARPGLSERARRLHELAGLLDRRIAELKEAVSAHRTELRKLTFVREARTDGPARFHLEGEPPSDGVVEPGTWRLKVGAEPLPLEALPVFAGGAVVGTIPEGLPALRLPRFDWTILPKLFAAAVIISLLGFMEAISIAKSMAARTAQKLDPDQELIGQGLSNIVGCMSQSYPVSGSFSRSAVNLAAGGQTGLSNVFSSGVVMIVLLFFAPWLYHLPQAVLASIIMMAVLGLLNVSSFLHTWRTSRFEGTVTLLTFTGTLGFAPHLEWGIAIGVALSVGAYLYRSMRPHVAELAPHPSGAMRDAKRYRLPRCRYIAVVSFEGPLNFASTAYLEREILGRVSELADLKHLLIACEGISEVDASGEETLRRLVGDLRSAGYRVSLVGVPEKVLDVFRRSRLLDEIGTDHLFATRAQAVTTVFSSAHAGVEEPGCPYRSAMPPVCELSLHSDGSFRDAGRHGLEKCRHIASLRIDGSINFANTAFLEQEILDLIADRPALRHVVFFSHGIMAIDDSGAVRLGDLVQKLRASGLAVSFSGLTEDALRILTQNHVTAILESDNLYVTHGRAIASIYARAHSGSSESGCPLQRVAPRLTELSLHDSGTLRNAENHRLQLCRHIGVLRFGGPFVLSNRKAIQSEFIHWAKTRPEVRSVVFDVSTLDSLDEGEAEVLGALVEDVRDAGYRVTFGGFTDRAFETVARSGVADAIGHDEIYPAGLQAVAAVFSDSHADQPVEDCPLAGVLPRLIELSRHADGALRDASRHGLALCQRIVVVRFDGPLNVATIGHFEKELRRAVERRPAARHLLIGGHTFSDLDRIAAEELPLILERLERDGYRAIITGLKDEHLDLLRTGRGLERFGPGQVPPTLDEGIFTIYYEAHRDANNGACPLISASPAP